MLLKVENLKKYYPIQTTFLERLFARNIDYIKAVDDISFKIETGEIFALVGETGCGKTTTAETILRLQEPTDGKIFFEGEDISKVEGQELKKLRSQMQILFQDPFSSFNPRMSVGNAIGHPLKIHNRVKDEEEKEAKVKEWLEEVGLTPVSEYYSKFPQGLSGGEIQRTALARAMILNPKLIAADEPTSNLDVSLQAKILELIEELREDLNVSFLYITHNLAVAKYISDRIGIMYLGKIVELGNSQTIFSEPLHPYTQALLSTVPVPDPKRKRIKAPLKREPPDPINLPSGCRFHPRCPESTSKCTKKEPMLREVSEGHYVMCHEVTSTRSPSV